MTVAIKDTSFGFAWSFVARSQET